WRRPRPQRPLPRSRNRPRWRLQTSGSPARSFGLRVVVAEWRLIQESVFEPDGFPPGKIAIPAIFGVGQEPHHCVGADLLKEPRLFNLVDQFELRVLAQVREPLCSRRKLPEFAAQPLDAFNVKRLPVAIEGSQGPIYEVDNVGFARARSPVRGYDLG